MVDVAVERIAPDEAFELLGHELRLTILRTLNDAGAPLSFSELRDTVDVRDSGRFNYHLEKLVGNFVRKTDEGYRLTRAGQRVVGAVLSGGYTHVHDAKPVSMETSCRSCDSKMEARFDEETVTIACSSCDLVFTDPSIPPAAMEGWDRRDVPGVVHRWMRRLLVSSDLGLCPYCDGRVVRSVYLAGDHGAPEWFEPGTTDFEATVVFDCHRCAMHWHAMVEIAALAHPAVVGFHYEHGIDLRQTPEWALDWFAGPQAEVTNQEPFRIDLPIRLDDETRRFVFDDEMELVEMVSE